jgi:CelD/BcsL family acetyltransferase involved in cellulose biosynthesis
MTGTSIEIIDDPERMRALEPAWRALTARREDDLYFTTFDWHWCAWEQVSGPKGRQLRVVVVWRGDAAVVILPLAVERFLLWRRGRWLGRVTSYYEDALVDPNEETAPLLAEAWAAVAASGIDFIPALYVRKDAALFPLLSGLRGSVFESSPTAFIDWREWPDWDAYWASLSRSRRRDQKRKRGLLAKQGETTFEEVTEPEDVQRAISWIVDHKRAWIRERKMVTSRFDTAEADFLYAIAETARACGSLYLGLLRLDGRIIAAELGFVYNGEVHLAVPSYDIAYQRYSPGGLMFEESLRRSRSRGLNIYDFNEGKQTYMATWARGSTEAGYFLVPCTIMGRLYVAWKGSRLRDLVLWTYRFIYGLVPGRAARSLRALFLR